jgi:hypothetical protein
MSAESTTSKKEIESQVNLLKKLLRAYGVVAGEGRMNEIVEFTKEDKASGESILPEDFTVEDAALLQYLVIHKGTREILAELETRKTKKRNLTKKC